MKEIVLLVVAALAAIAAFGVIFRRTGGECMP